MTNKVKEKINGIKTGVTDDPDFSISTFSRDIVTERTEGIDKLIEKYPFLKDYEINYTTHDFFIIHKLAKKFEKQLTNKVRKIESDEEDIIGEFERFDAVTDEICVFVRHIFEYASVQAYIFIKKDYDKQFRKEFSVTDTQYYKPGTYHLLQSSGGFYLKQTEIKEEKEPIFNENLKQSLIKDVDFFFENKKLFDDNNLSYKRGILLYGGPGQGKSSVIKSILKKFEGEYHCIIVDKISEWDKRRGDFLKYATNGKKRIIVIEDIDGLESYRRSEFLNFIDGVENTENMLLIATCNDVNKIDPALINRPSRFDRVYYIGYPDEKTRCELLKLYVPELPEKRLNECAVATKGFTGAYFKELFLCTKLNPEKDILEVINILQLQIKLYATNGKDVEKDDDGDEGIFG